jgi:uncharacterized membrane protein YeaQ/YmgE (transglycosylase-associated protein family)
MVWPDRRHAYDKEDRMEGMGLIAWIVLGLIAGLIAKALVPGKDPGGCFVTVLIGIVGAVLGGFLATLLGFGGISGFDWRSLLIAVAGSAALLALLRLFRGKK